MLRLDHIFRHCTDILQPAEPSAVCPVYYILELLTLQDEQSMRQVLPPQYSILMCMRQEYVV